MKIRILHAYYGCDTGCCGHVIEIDGEEVRSSFRWGHPGSKSDVEDIILEHVPDVCLDTLDWDTVEVDDMGWC